MKYGDYIHMHKWCIQFKDHPDVVKWLNSHPPPDDFVGSPARYAYETMPMDLFVEFKLEGDK